MDVLSKIAKKVTKHSVYPEFLLFGNQEFPKIFQIQTQSACNAKCVFCPYPTLVNKQAQGRMNDELFKKIVDEISHYDVLRISPYLHAEPLLDQKIDEKINYIKEKNPKATVKITTNGSMITEKMAHKLVNSKLDLMDISIHSLNPENYKKIMSLDLDLVLNRIDYMISLNPKFKIYVVIVRTNDEEKNVDEYVKFWEKKGIKVLTNRVTDRASTVENYDELKVKARRTLRDTIQEVRGCVKPLKQGYILYNGDMIYCCSDWTRTTILGNVKERSIKDVWDSTYKMRKTKNIAICNRCERRKVSF